MSAAALAIGSLSVAPHAANANTIPVNITVPAYAYITSTDPNITATWDGQTRMAIPFSVNVMTNDYLGYTLTFTGAYTNLSGQFGLKGTNGAVSYNVQDNSPQNYKTGVAGKPVGGVLASPPIFNLLLTGFPAGAVGADTYTDTLTVTVAPV
jgi:hypothetical protein